MSASHDEIERMLARLAQIDAANRAREPQPRTGEELPDLLDAKAPYDAARSTYQRRAHRLRQIEREASTVAAELLPPLPSSSNAIAADDDRPEVTLRALQLQLLRHPIAFRAAFAGLIAEGRKFAETPSGAAWHERLRCSPMLPDIRLMLKMVSLSMLDEDDPERLPSAYLDALFRTAASGDADAILNRLFGGLPDVDDVG